MLDALRAMSSDTVSSLGDGFVKNVGALCQAARATDITALAEQYGMRVGHAVRGTCPPYELEYADGEIIQRASELADIAGFYEAFGLSSAGPEHDRPDHFSAECEFLQVMTIKI